MDRLRHPPHWASVLAAWIVFFLVWLAASGSFETARVLTGILVTLVLSHLAVSRLSFWSGVAISPGRLRAALVFLAVFLRDMIVSNFAVLRYVYVPGRRPRAAIITVPLTISGPRERLALTNALALTPGTLAIDLKGGVLDVHLLDTALAEGAVQSVKTYETLLERALG